MDKILFFDIKGFVVFIFILLIIKKKMENRLENVDLRGATET